MIERLLIYFASLKHKQGVNLFQSRRIFYMGFKFLPFFVLKLSDYHKNTILCYFYLNKKIEFEFHSIKKNVISRDIMNSLVH